VRGESAAESSNASLPLLSVQENFGSDIAYLVNLKTGQQVQVLRNTGEKKEGRAKLVFQNTATGHVLKTID
jgi:hypothetical protein